MDDTAAVRISYDEDADAAYVHLQGRLISQPSVATTVPVDASINLDFDDEGRLIGIEVLDARRLLRPEVLAPG